MPLIATAQITLPRQISNRLVKISLSMLFIETNCRMILDSECPPGTVSPLESLFPVLWPWISNFMRKSHHRCSGDSQTTAHISARRTFVQAELQVPGTVFWEPAVHISVFIYNFNMKQSWYSSVTRESQAAWRFQRMKKFFYNQGSLKSNIIYRCLWHWYVFCIKACFSTQIKLRYALVLRFAYTMPYFEETKLIKFSRRENLDWVRSTSQ